MRHSAIYDLYNNVVSINGDDGNEVAYDVNGDVVEIDNTLIDIRASELLQQEQLKDLRSERNQLLQETDWIIIKSQEEGSFIPENWKSYRQALRDITDTYTSLDDVVWPTKPE